MDGNSSHQTKNKQSPIYYQDTEKVDESLHAVFLYVRQQVTLTSYLCFNTKHNLTWPQ